MFYILTLIAIAIIAVEIFSAKQNKKTNQADTASKSWHAAYKWRYLLGAPFAVGSYFISYPISGGNETYTVMGFPLMAAAFDESGSDYVGPTTGPFILINAVIWYFLPFIILFLWSRFNANKNA